MKQLVLLSFLVFSLSITTNASAKSTLRQIDFTTNELKNIGGHYSTIYGYIYIQVNGKRVSTNVDGKNIQLIKKSDGRFYPRYKLLNLFPINLGDLSFSLMLNENKQQIRMYKKNNKNKKLTARIVAQKFEPKVVPPLWKSRLGKYKATLVKGKSKIKDIRLAIKRGVLVAFINKLKNPYPLLALSSSKLFSPSAGHNKERKINIGTKNKLLTLSYGTNNLLLTKL